MSSVVATKALPSSSGGDMGDQTVTEKPKCKACCACPETKRVRDECIMENGEMNCQSLIEAHKQSVPRILSEAEMAQLAKHDYRPVSSLKRFQLEKETIRSWDRFYKRNTDKFFKDRHWTTREFSELVQVPLGPGSSTKLLEIGCGVGNFVFPLLEDNPSLFIYACDLSPTAIALVKENPQYAQGKCSAFVADVTEGTFHDNLSEPVDIVTLIFVLSAIRPDKMSTALSNVRKVLRPGGIVLFRDYGLYDHAMIRFAPGHKLDERFYYRQDGTYTYYFTTEELCELFTSNGFEVDSCVYIHRQTVNKKEDLNVERIFIQGRFRLPSPE
ncbi:hypothetical protein RvY_08164 [Ramazzottius varieornatus]|uniref:Methyltransferase type 12 domain-containing protein n=1 Tax=Ramazzottius varieornatus TaxID=947166 RepID=A0A1D1V9M6_RAMVA|nr:hypothetical protein RvY_08164 [Ramazzottius varieornatus]